MTLNEWHAAGMAVKLAVVVSYVLAGGAFIWVGIDSFDDGTIGTAFAPLLVWLGVRLWFVSWRLLSENFD